MKKIAKALLLVFFAFWNAQSQNILTLEQCLALARERSPQLRGVQNTIRSGELARKELSTTALPQIRLQATPFYAPFSRNFGYDPTTTDGGQLAGQIVVQQSLFDGGIRSLRSSQLGIDLERTGYEFRLADRDLTFAVKQAFYQVLGSEQETILERESVTQLKDYLDLVKRLYNGGSASYTDVLKTDLQLSNANLEYHKALDDLAVAKYSLAEIIGSPIDTSFGIRGDVDTSATASLDSLVRVAGADTVYNVELRSADLEIQSGQVGVEMIRHETWPVISFSGDAGYLSSGVNLKLAPPDRESAVGFGFGIVVDIPLVNWGATDLRVQQQQLSVNNLRLESERIQRSITSEARKTGLQLLRLRERLQSVRGNLKKAEENFVLTKSKFAGGGTLSLEVLAAQQLLTETRLAEVRTLTDIQVLTAKLVQLTTL